MARINSKIKKIMLLTTGLAGGLIATSVAGITLSSCTFQVQQDPNNNQSNNNNNNSSSNKPTSPKDELTYNPNANYYTTQIIFDANGNITNNFANKLTIDGPFIFADPSKSILIGMAPGVEISSVTIPSAVKKITGYNAAVVYDTTTGKIVNPSFSVNKDLVLGENQALLDLGNVGAFQKLGKNAIVEGDAANPPKLADGAITGLDFVTSIQCQNGSQLQSIGPKAFLGCSNLTSVSLPDSCNTIGAQAFQNCTNLQTINLKGAQYIGDAAFNNAFIANNNAIARSNPVSLDLSSAQYIGQGAFDSSIWTKPAAGVAANVRAANATNNAFSGENGAEEKGQISKISSVTFGSKLNTLKAYAFNGDNYLTNIDLSSCTSLATISNNAFSKTQNLKTVKFSNTISTIEDNAFSGAQNLTSANFPSGLETIGTAAFSGAPLSGSFSPESTTLNIGQSAFVGSQFDTIDFSKVTGDLTIGNSAFNGDTALKSITFADNNKLEPNSQLKIMSQAFAGCNNLVLGTANEGQGATGSTFSMPQNLTLLARDAFDQSVTQNLTSTYANAIDISSDTLISDNAFGGKWGKLNQNGDVQNDLTDVNTIALGPQLFANDQNVTSIDLSGSNIQALGFTRTNSISNVIGNGFTIPGGNHTSPQLGTFANCTSLQTLTLPATCSQFGASAVNYYWSSPFANCKSLANINYNGFKLTDTSDTVTAGFKQMNEDTWRQVANIMNTFGYAGQQTIGVDGTVTDDPSAETGTWASINGLGSKGYQNARCWQSGMNGWYADNGSDNSWVNQPINVYGADNYKYNVAAVNPEVSNVQSRATNGEVTVSYPAGLGYSVAATVNTSDGNQQTGTLSAVVGDGAATADYLIVSQSNLNDNTAIQVPKSIANDNETITISGSRPLSVWYTMSKQDNPANNIYVPTDNKLVGSTTNTATEGGISWTSTALNQEVNKKPDGSPISNAGTPFKSSKPEGAGDDDAQLQQFYTLPLGITENTVTAYFNHNGVIWQYKKDAATGAITITGTVNYYIGGQITNEQSGLGPHTITGQTFNNSGTGLTSVSNLGAGANNPFYGLDGKTSYQYSSSTAGLFLFNQNGKTTDGADAQISNKIGPKGITVTLTLVPGTTNSGQQ